MTRTFLHLSAAMCGLALYLISASSHALPDDANQPIHIEADRAELNQRTNTVVYTGRVRLTQGTLLLEADQLTVTQTSSSEGRSLKSALATGKPAHFSQQLEPQEDPAHGYGRRIDYNAIATTITLTDDAKLIREGNNVSGQRIVYNMTTKLINAGSTPAKKGGTNTPPARVKVILQPSNVKPSKQKATP